MNTIFVPWLAPCVPAMPYAQYIASLIGMSIVVLIAGLLVLFWMTGQQIYSFVLEQKLRLADHLDAKDKIIADKEAEIQRGVDDNALLRRQLEAKTNRVRTLEADNAQLQLRVSLRDTKTAPWLDDEE